MFITLSSIRVTRWALQNGKHPFCGLHATCSMQLAHGCHASSFRYSDRRSYDHPPSNGSSRDWSPPPPTQESYGSGGPPDGGGPNGNSSGGQPMDNFTKAVIAGAFIMGMGTGVWFNSEATFYPSNVASTEVIDRRTPNSEVCMANGYSSMVFDERVFVSFNPCAAHPDSRHCRLVMRGRRAFCCDLRVHIVIWLAC